MLLDEGFGMLDEEDLDTALETLAVLQQDRKLIGVISHASALKERISALTEGIPQTGERSLIRGPGGVKRDQQQVFDLMDRKRKSHDTPCL